LNPPFVKLLMIFEPNAVGLNEFHFFPLLIFIRSSSPAADRFLEWAAG